MISLTNENKRPKVQFCHLIYFEKFLYYFLDDKNNVKLYLNTFFIFNFYFHQEKCKFGV